MNRPSCIRHTGKVSNCCRHQAASFDPHLVHSPLLNFLFHSVAKLSCQLAASFVMESPSGIARSIARAGLVSREHHGSLHNQADLDRRGSLFA